MSKNLWDKDRKVIVRQLIKEYLEEGDASEATLQAILTKNTAIEVDTTAIATSTAGIADKMSFVENIQNEAWESEDG